MQVITTHQSADFDCLASMVAAQKLYPQARMVFSGSVETPVQAYLQHFNFPFQLARIKEIDLNAVDLLIVVDTHDPQRIGKFESLLNQPAVSVHLFDHHVDSDSSLSSEKTWIENRGACATLLFEHLRKQNIALTPQEATLLLLGIYQDTHSLISPSTTPEDFRAVADLVTMGGDLNTVADFVQPRLNPEQVEVLNDLIASLETTSINGFEIAIATAVVENYVGDLAMVASKIMELENLNALFTIVGLDQRMYLIGRSRTEHINVGSIMRELGGGGHPQAASASMNGQTLVQVRERLITQLNESIESPTRVEYFMHTPPVSVNAGDSIKQVEQVLTRCNLNTLPVLQDDVPVGLITRQIVEKAIHHKMQMEPASDLMIREFSVCHPDSFFKDLIPIIVEEKQKLVPVVEPQTETLIGVVSRGDLLRVLYGDFSKYATLAPNLFFNESPVPFKNIKSLMKERLPKKIMDLIQSIIAAGDATGVSVFVVGGFVRDLLLGIENLDLDVVVEGDGIQFAQALKGKLGGRVRSHQKFVTAVLILEDGFKIDIASARMEYYERPAALPTVRMSSIKSDLFRRDFSFNSLAIQLNGADAYKLIDYFNGQRDLKNKAVRVLHNLSFIEDPCRAFRAVRFEQRFQFTIGKQTEAFLKNAVQKGLIHQLSGSRLMNEFTLLLKETRPAHCLLRMKDLGLLQVIHPEFLQTPESQEALAKIEETLSWSDIVVMPKPPDPWKVYLLGLVYFLGPNDFEIWLKQMHAPMKLAKQLKEDCLGVCSGLKTFEGKKQFLASEVYEVFSGLSPEAIIFLMVLTKNPEVPRQVLLYLTQYQARGKIALSGEDLINIGISTGPIFSKIFKALRTARLEGEITTREEEKAFVEKYFKSKIHTAEKAD